uniref:Uncharacterized protein n=1 Tax=Arundo donax TaxID=35708 RepID=A0A0A8Y7H7_ARUDO
MKPKQLIHLPFIYPHLLNPS